FAGAETIAKVEPQYAKQIIAGAQSSFVDGADWAYVAGIVAILLGFALVFFFFPKKEKEQELLAEYVEQDTEPGVTSPGG
ncbi:MAG: MFS transporter, partial [Acidimicrobiia bacterium]